MSVHQHETTGSVRQRSRDQTDGGEWYATPHDLFAFENRSFARLGKNRSCAKLVTFVRSFLSHYPLQTVLEDVLMNIPNAFHTSSPKTSSCDSSAMSDSAATLQTKSKLPPQNTPSVKHFRRREHC